MPETLVAKHWRHIYIVIMKIMRQNSFREFKFTVFGFCG